jgi:hypothetical protein
MQLGFVAAVWAVLTVGAAQQHDHAMMQRGAHAMGFDQTRTTHRFLIERGGGAIQVTAKDAADVESVKRIRGHLAHIERAFASGDFALPMFIHATQPPGVEVLRERRSHLVYRVEEIPAGARLAITTSDREALDALHAFLRFQIVEHKTGDRMEPT